MKRRVKIYEFTCDRCKKVEIVSSTSSFGDPHSPGWNTVAVHDCGSTGYTRHDDVCPECYEKYTKEAQKEQGENI